MKNDKQNTGRNLKFNSCAESWHNITTRDLLLTAKKNQLKTSKQRASVFHRSFPFNFSPFMEGEDKEENTLLLVLPTKEIKQKKNTQLLDRTMCLYDNRVVARWQPMHIKTLKGYMPSDSCYPLAMLG
jgi:hypothetical protein